MGVINNENNKRYFTIVGGKIREKVEEGTEGAKLREGELKDGTTYSKWELVSAGLSGVITDVSFFDGQYGKNIVITLEDPDDGTLVLTIGADNKNTGIPFMLALPNIKMDEVVVFKPYDFTDPKTKERVSGLSIQQNGEKIKSAFYDPITKKNLLGMPEPKKNRKGEVDWKVHFTLRDAWLQDYMVDNNYIQDSAPAVATEEAEKDEDDF